MQFEFRIEEKKDHVVIQLSGNLLQHNQAIDMLDEFKASLAQNYNMFNIDLENLKTINSSGIDIFLYMLTKARIAGGDAVFYNAGNDVMSVINFSMLNKVLNIKNKTIESVGT